MASWVIFASLVEFLECFKSRSAVHFYAGVQCASVSTCVFVYIHSERVFASHFSEAGGGNAVRRRDAAPRLEVKSTRERVCGCSDQDVYASVAVEGCAKESCLLLCLASVKAVYIGPRC